MRLTRLSDALFQILSLSQSLITTRAVRLCAVSHTAFIFGWRRTMWLLQRRCTGAGTLAAGRAGARLGKLEAPPGFEPGEEVLQSKHADRASHEIAELFSKSAIRVVPRWLEFGPFGSPR